MVYMIKTFVLLFLEILFICFVFVCIIVEQWKEKKDYIKSELIGGGWPKYLKNFSDFILIILLAIHNTHINYCSS